MVKFTEKDVKKFLKKAKIDISKEKFTVKDIARGMSVELEHGRKNKRTNVTNDDPIITLKIALAHLYEMSDYYTKLATIEKSGGARVVHKRYYLTQK
jgi:hypothetical protein